MLPLLIISGCATKQVEVISKPIEIEIIQPTMPRAIDLKEPRWFVVSEAKVSNPCVKNEEGKRDCTLGKEHPDWPDGYTYLDKFIDDIKKLNGGDVVFVAMTIDDYELMSFNMQELRRYLREVKTWGINEAKFKAAEEFCENKGWKWQIITEDILKNTK